MNRQERADELETAITGAIAELEATMANGKSEDFVKSLEWWSRFRDYSWNNSILILLQRPDAIQMAGFRAWEKLGFHVKAGETATWIRGPILKKVPDQDTGELEERLVGYMPVAVFDIAQTAEYPDKQPAYPFKPSTEADWEHLYICWTRRLQTLHGVNIRELDMGIKTYGSASTQGIRINSRHEFGIKGPVLLHEVCHLAAHHPTAEAHAKWNLQEREAQVEAATYVLCRMLGAVHPHSANYLLHYKVDAGMLSAHLETIGKIVRDVRVMLDFKHLAKEVAAQEAVAA